jgi:hypothetical protein
MGMDISVLGVDLGKNLCSVVGLDPSGAVVMRQRFRRLRQPPPGRKLESLTRLFGNPPPIPPARMTRRRPRSGE